MATESCYAFSRSQVKASNPAGIAVSGALRLEHQGWIASHWGESENKRKAKFYRLTRAGQRRFHSETEKWNRMTSLIAGILRTTSEEV